MSLFSKTKVSDDDSQIAQMAVKWESTIETYKNNEKKLMDDLKDARDTITNFVDIKLGYEDEKKKLILSHNKELERLKNEILMEKNSVAKKVNAELSKIGTTFVNEEIMKSPELSTTDIYTQFQNMKLGSVEANEFYVKNKDAIKTHLQNFKQTINK